MGLKVDKILCTTDFSALSNKGIDYAISLAKDFGAELKIVHVYGLPTYFALPEAAVIPSAGYASDRSNELQHMMDATVKEYGDRGVEVHGFIKLGVNYEEIVREATIWGADMIVMASHGHSGIAHAILGSVTERVLRTAHCPVMVVRNDNA